MAQSPELDALIPGLSDNREGMRRFAIRKAAALGADAAPGLIALLACRDGYAGESAAAALVEMGRPAVPALLHAMEAPDRSLRWEAAAILAQMGPEVRAEVDRARPASARLSAMKD